MKEYSVSVQMVFYFHLLSCSYGELHCFLQKIAEVSYLIVLEAGSLKSKYWKDHTPPEGAKEGSVPDLFPSCSSSSLTSHDVLPMCVTLYKFPPFHRDTNNIELGLILMTFNLIISAKTLSM